MMAAEQDHAGAKQAAAGGGQRKRTRSARAGADAGAGGGSATKKKVPSSPAAAPAPASASSAHQESAAASLVYVTVDSDVLDCRVCFLPLKPPIYQCDVGHVVCSPCCEKLKATGKCHVCDVATSSYRRCYDMERLLDSIQIPCAYASHGCPVTPAYHNQESHRLACVHAPCHCPDEACRFVGSTEALLNHFTAVHNWRCITTDNTNITDITVRDGFNFVLADAVCTGNKEQGATTSVKCLALLTLARKPHGCIISVHCIDPHSGQGPNSKQMHCKLVYSVFPGWFSSSDQFVSHYQTSVFRIVCTDLSNGVPKPDDCFQVVVPNSVIGDHDKDGIKVNVSITIN